MSRRTGTFALLGAASLVALAASNVQAQVGQQLPGQAGVSEAASGRPIAMERKLAKPPAEALSDAEVSKRSPGPAQFKAGNPGTARSSAARLNADDAESGPVPENYGAGNLNTIYHYTDYLVSSRLRNDAPYRFSGWFVFTAADNNTYRCTASLISRSILVTAGHCVHLGGGGSSRFIRSGTYQPAYSNGASSTYGSATANYVVTTGGWANTGGLDAGYDVGLVTLNKRTGTSQEIGTSTGWYGFCYENCLQNYWYNSQIGYPGNYYGGNRMTQGEHLERSDTRDYVYGSGMQGGSSGGPHVANFGALSDTASNLGQFTQRNIVFATTSWLYTDQSIKIQGASSLSGPNNSNNFRAMYNLACNRARSLHGTGSCSLL